MTGRVYTSSLAKLPGDDDVGNVGDFFRETRVLLSGSPLRLRKGTDAPLQRAIQHAAGGRPLIPSHALLTWNLECKGSSLRADYQPESGSGMLSMRPFISIGNRNDVGNTSFAQT